MNSSIQKLMTSTVLKSIVLLVLLAQSLKSSAQTSCQWNNDGSQSKLLRPDLAHDFWSKDGPLKRVRDGLALTIDRKVYELDESRKVLRVFGGRCRLAFDIWGDFFYLLDDSHNPSLTLNVPNHKDQWALEHCAGVLLPPLQGKTLRVIIKVNPIDEKQEQETRKWLATKGIGGPSAGVIGRAIGAVINLRTEKEADYECSP